MDNDMEARAREVFNDWRRAQPSGDERFPYDIAKAAFLAGAASAARSTDDFELMTLAEILAHYRAYLDGETPRQAAEAAFEAGKPWPDEDDIDWAWRISALFPSARSTAVEREAVARLLCKLAGHDPDGGPKGGFGYINYLDDADAILQLLQGQGREEGKDAPTNNVGINDK